MSVIIYIKAALDVLSLGTLVFLIGKVREEK